MSKFTGSCLCGAVRYTLEGEPITTVLCHCNNCQKSSGSTFQANLFFKQENLTFVSGEDKLTRYFDHATDSGGTPTRMFCRICGSNVITTNESNDWVRGKVIVMSGCLDNAQGLAGEQQRPAFEPKQEFYCKAKCAWMEVIPKTQRFQAMS